MEAMKTYLITKRNYRRKHRILQTNQLHCGPLSKMSSSVEEVEVSSLAFTPYIWCCFT